MPADIPLRSNWTILCDFDGTIAPSDVTDRLLERYAAPEWRQIERAWQRKEIGSYDCLLQQTALLSMTAGDLQESLAGVQIDPAFADFVTFAQERQCKVRVASEGYTQVIRALLRRAEVPPLPIAATHLIPDGANRWMLGCPFTTRDCISDAATCKCAVARENTPAGAQVLLIGDGRSDFCVAAQADFVFARGALLEFCRAQSLPHAAVGDFAEARRRLMSLLDTPANPGVHAVAAAGEHHYG